MGFAANLTPQNGKSVRFTKSPAPLPCECRAHCSLLTRHPKMQCVWVSLRASPPSHVRAVRFTANPVPHPWEKGSLRTIIHGRGAWCTANTTPQLSEWCMVYFERYTTTLGVVQGSLRTLHLSHRRGAGFTCESHTAKGIFFEILLF